eukprot:4978546-Amphidinium_carterae.1
MFVMRRAEQIMYATTAGYSLSVGAAMLGLAGFMEPGINALEAQSPPPYHSIPRQILTNHSELTIQRRAQRAQSISHSWFTGLAGREVLNPDGAPHMT